MRECSYVVAPSDSYASAGFDEFDRGVDECVLEVRVLEVIGEDVAFLPT